MRLCDAFFQRFLRDSNESSKTELSCMFHHVPGYRPHTTSYKLAVCQDAVQFQTALKMGSCFKDPESNELRIMQSLALEFPTSLAMADQPHSHPYFMSPSFKQQPILGKRLRKHTLNMQGTELSGGKADPATQQKNLSCRGCGL